MKIQSGKQYVKTVKNELRNLNKARLAGNNEVKLLQIITIYLSNRYN